MIRGRSCRPLRLDKPGSTLANLNAPLLPPCGCQSTTKRDSWYGAWLLQASHYSRAWVHPHGPSVPLALYTSAQHSVRVAPPMRPAILRPGQTLPGSWQPPMEPPALCARLLPCEAGCPAKPQRFITPWKPFPIVVPACNPGCHIWMQSSMLLNQCQSLDDYMQCTCCTFECNN